MMEAEIADAMAQLRAGKTPPSRPAIEGFSSEYLKIHKPEVEKALDIDSVEAAHAEIAALRFSLRDALGKHVSAESVTVDAGPKTDPTVAVVWGGAADA